MISVDAFHSSVSRGGSLVKRKENKPVVDYIFCRGRTDPWFPRRVVTEETNCIYAYRPAPRLSQHAIVVSPRMFCCCFGKI